MNTKEQIKEGPVMNVTKLSVKFNEWFRSGCVKIAYKT